MVWRKKHMIKSIKYVRSVGNDGVKMTGAKAGTDAVGSLRYKGMLSKLAKKKPSKKIIEEDETLNVGQGVNKPPPKSADRKKILAELGDMLSGSNKK